MKLNWGAFSLVSGIIGLMVCWVPLLGIIPGILAIWLYRKDKEAGMAKAGLVLGILTLIASLFVLFMSMLLGVIVSRPNF